MSEAVELRKVERSGAFEVEGTQRDFYFAILAATTRRPGRALKDNRTLIVGGGKHGMFFKRKQTTNKIKIFFMAVKCGVWRVGIAPITSGSSDDRRLGLKAGLVPRWKRVSKWKLV